MSKSAESQIVAIVGMCGAGKTEAAEVFLAQGWGLVRFGQITLDEVLRRGLPVSEANEKEVREEMRRRHGMAAYAIVNIPKIEALRSQGPVIIDGLYSWSELKALRERFGDALIVLAVYASTQTRYNRLEDRATRHADDTEKRFRSIPRADSMKRDYAEIENVEKGGPIAMADVAIINEGSLEELKQEVHRFILKSKVQGSDLK